MKIRVLRAIGIGWLAVHSTVGWGIVPPRQQPLPNLDQRQGQAQEAAGGALQPQGVALAAAQAQARALTVLQERVPGVTVSRDAVLGMPRLIASSEGFLTGPSGEGRALTPAAFTGLAPEDPHRVVKAFLNEHADLFGHNADALASAVTKRDYVTEHNGMRTVVLEQRLGGIPVFEGLLQYNLTKRGELIRISDQFVPNAPRAASKALQSLTSGAANPQISAAVAVTRAAANVGTELESQAVEFLGEPEGATMTQKVQAPGLNGETHVQLVWLPMNRDSVRLCWQVILTSRARGEMFRVLVDAETGEVLVRQGLTKYQAAQAASYRVYTSDSPSPFSPGWSTPNTQQPPAVPRTLLSNFRSISSTASPDGWLDPANLNGAFQTTGNNVDAHTDRDDDDRPDVPRPQSAANPPVFDFPLDLTQQPSAYTNAAVVNLFYWNNFMHDKLYDLGFTEAAGNFQNDTFGRGGAGNDAVNADAQDGATLNDGYHFNNANFSTPPDGLPGRMQMYLFDGPNPMRDGDLDAEIMCHEYTHGLTGRMVGGGDGLNSLQAYGLAEGWSDFYALSLLSEPSDDPHGVYAYGGYATYQLYGMTENYYYGIRRYPYCTDMSKNPLTFKDIDDTQADPHIGVPKSPIDFGSSASEVHNQGEVWCVTLWDARANLIDSWGWDEGNQTMLQIVTDALRLTPPEPTFIEARDAILQADEVNNGGANRNELWLAFAKRGFGVNAQAPPSYTTVGVVEDFTVPDDVIVRPPTGVLELLVFPGEGSTLPGGTSTPIFARVRDGVGVTNATVRCRVDGVTDLPFNNVGSSPDARQGDSIYSASLGLSATVTNVMLDFTVSAPGKTNVSMRVSYYVATVPANDLFAGSIKVRARGDAYVSNNKFASVEQSEPQHASVATAGNSLWWDWTPTNSSPVLIDTAGSAFSSVIAVYTGDSLGSLKEVKAVGSVPQRKQSYLFFDAEKGKTYRIAIASVNTNSAGFLSLRIAPNGSPDITPPEVSIESPVSGRVFTNNVVPIVASAFDPEPMPSGVDKFNVRVSPRSLQAAQFSAAGLGATTNQVALVRGRNTITVTASDVAGNTSEPVSITVTYRPREPANDHFDYALWLTSDSGSAVINSVEATKEPGEPRHASHDGGKSVWWKWQAPADGSLLLSTEGTTFDTLLGLYQGSRVDRLTTISANDDAFDGVTFSKLRSAVRSNQVYHVAVDGFSGASGIVQLAYEFLPTNLFTVNVAVSGNGEVIPASGVLNVEANSTLTLRAAPANNYEFAVWEGDLSSTDNPWSFLVKSNLNLTAVFRPLLVSDDFETGDLAKLPWTSGGDADWYVVTNDTEFQGQYVLRSGRITHNQTSSLTLTTEVRAGTGRFDYRVDSEEGWDKLSFYVDGQFRQEWSGDVIWNTYEFNLTAGSHTLKWEYSKDAANSTGLDAAFIDNVDLPLTVPVDDTTAAWLAIQQLPSGDLQLLVKGQTNQIYVIQATERIPVHWFSVTTNEARNGEIRFSDPDALNSLQRFYRAVVK